MEQVIRTRISEEIKEKFVKKAQENGMTASELLRIFIEKYVAGQPA